MLSLATMNRQGASTPWRLLDTGYRSGAENMAIDEAMLEAMVRKEIPPTLRFYGWQPACLSLGYFQHGEREVDFAACRERGVDVVRRLTGGRAVLHAREITYSIVCPEDYPSMPMTITASYRFLSRGLLLGLEELGIGAEMTKPTASYGQRRNVPASAACFDSPSHYELTVDRRKLIGSAQLRRQGVILQHGSILLDFSAQELCDLLRLDGERKEKTLHMLEERVIDIRTALGRTAGYDEVRDAVTKGFAGCLGIELFPGELTVAELQEAQRLQKEKYGSGLWTEKR